MTDIVIGFDTSNYTTSVAVCTSAGDVIANLKLPLPVEHGKVGLRQSDAVFAHIKNLPVISGQLADFLGNGRYRVAAVACSSAPRSAKGSYMPCFLSGRAAASSVASALGVPLIETSHQIGHVTAAAYSATGSVSSACALLEREYIALHVSGGTTDILHVKPSYERLVDVSRIGGSDDANAGQIIDRVGVKLGFSFPCGPEMDLAACEYPNPIKVGRLPVYGASFNMSGLENIAARMISDGESVEAVSAYVLEYTSEILKRAICGAMEITGECPVVFAGGVMSSKYIRKRMNGIGLFAHPSFSADNAAGVAFTGALLLGRGCGALMGGSNE